MPRLPLDADVTSYFTHGMNKPGRIKKENGKTLTKFRGFFLAMVDLFLTRMRGGLMLFASKFRETPLG